MSESKYLLNRDAKESARLIEQHEWLKTLVGCAVHPSIKLNTPGIRIADVATGTGIFLLDLPSSTELASDAKLFGFDISAAQFPKPDELPSNVSLHEHNATKPWSEEYRGSFDVVAVRLITAGLRGNDWDAAVEGVSSLLKPGGYLQWIEPVHSSIKAYTRKAGAPNAAARKAVDYFQQAYHKVLYPGPLQLPELLKKHQLQEVATELFATDHYHDFEKVRNQGKLFLSGALTAMASFIVNDETGPTAEQLKETVEESMRELDGDLFLRSEMQVLVARKAA